MPILAKQNAFEKGAIEAWLIDDGYITEGSASNAWIIQWLINILMTPQIMHPRNVSVRSH